MIRPTTTSDAARSAMLQASGRPPGGNGNPHMAGAELAHKSSANFSLRDRINEMANRDQEDWKYLTDVLRKLVTQRQADLDYLKRLLGVE